MGMNSVGASNYPEQILVTHAGPPSNILTGLAVGSSM